MKHLIYISIYFSFVATLASQDLNKIFYKIDTHADTIRYNFLDLEDLTLKLVHPTSDTTEKVRAMFYWIAKNISYDKIGLRNDFWQKVPFNKGMAKIALKKKKTICSGYTMLLKSMLDIENIENEIVIGNAKTEEPSRTSDFYDHVWNAVKIAGKWYLVDATWGRSNNGEIKNYYFFPDPKKFISNHFPEDPKWTLLESNISKEDYLNLPQVDELYFELGFGKTIPKIKKTKNSVTIAFEKIPKGIEIDFTVQEKGTYKADFIDFTIEEVKGEKLVKINLQNPENYKIEMTAMTLRPLEKHLEIMIIK